MSGAPKGVPSGGPPEGDEWGDMNSAANGDSVEYAEAGERTRPEPSSASESGVYRISIPRLP